MKNADQATAATADEPRRRLAMAPPARTNRSARRRLEGWTRERFGLGADDVVFAAEASCGLPGCPPVETVVAFWRGEEPRRQFKLFKPMAEVGPDDLPPRWMKDALIVVEGEGCDCC